MNHIPPFPWRIQVNHFHLLYRSNHVLWFCRKLSGSTVGAECTNKVQTNLRQAYLRVESPRFYPLISTIKEQVSESFKVMGSKWCGRACPFRRLSAGHAPHLCPCIVMNAQNQEAFAASLQILHLFIFNGEPNPPPKRC